MNLVVLAPVFLVTGVWVTALGVIVRLSPRRERGLPPTRHARRVRMSDIQG